MNLVEILTKSKKTEMLRRPELCLPPRIYFYLTHECNYTCDHCYIGSGPGKQNTRFEKELALRTIQELKGAELISFPGGEPTMHPEFFDIVDAALDVAKNVEVFTNGRNLFLLEQGIDRLAGYDSRLTVYVSADTFHLKHKGAEQAIRKATHKAREWTCSELPNISFISYDISQEKSEATVTRLGLNGLAETGVIFGNIGRATHLTGDFRIQEDKQVYYGNIHITYSAVCASEEAVIASHAGEDHPGIMGMISPDNKDPLQTTKILNNFLKQYK